MTPDRTGNSSQNIVSQLVLRKNSEQSSHNSSEVRGYSDVWFREPRIDIIRAKMVSLGEDGIRVHRKDYQTDPTRVSVHYVGDSKYRVLSTDGKNKNELTTSHKPKL